MKLNTKDFSGMSFRKRILVQAYLFSDFLTSESGETLAVFILTGAARGLLKDIIRAKTCLKFVFEGNFQARSFF